MESVEQRIEGIRNDRRHGAIYLAGEAIRTMAEAASACADDQWARCLRGVAAELAESRPAMAAVKNAARLAFERMAALGPSRAPAEYRRLCKKIEHELLQASEAAAGTAAELLSSSAMVLTCSYSSGVARTLGKAQMGGKSPRALVFEPSASSSGHGVRLAHDLESAGIESHLVGEAALFDAVSQTRLALTGADAVTPAFVVNGTPSLQLAQAAHSRLPLYVVCESIKLTDDAGQEPGFDRIPLHLITAVATERSLLSPQDIHRLIQAG